LTLKNKSDDPNGKSDIIKSKWDILNQSGDEMECDNLCNYTVQSVLLSKGNYIVKLTVTDKGGKSDSFQKQIKVKEDIIADFKCSLNESGPWYDCETDFKGVQKEQAYFKDNSTLSEGAASISSWLWKINDIPFLSGTGEVQVSSTEITSRSNIVELTVTDNKGRTDTTSYTFRARLPLPTWQEIGS
jgi:hypothetical protein